MPGTMKHLQSQLTNCDLISLVQPLIRCKVTRFRERKQLRLLFQSLQQESIVLMRTNDRNPIVCGNTGSSANMIQVAMCQNNLYRFQIVFRDGLDDLLLITAWIDNSGLHGGITPHKRAVLLKGGYRECCV